MKKKLLSLALIVAMMAAFVPFYAIDLPTVSAASESTNGECGDNLIWSFDETTGILTVSGNGAMYNYEIQDDFEGNAPWYDLRNKIKRVYFEGNITSIGDTAFYDCQLEEISIPDTVLMIGNNAFELDTDDGGYKTSGITFGKSLKSIGDYAFAGVFCEKITIPSTVQKIGKGAFSSSYYFDDNGTVYSYINVPDSITDIGEDAFFGSANMFGNHIRYSYDSSTKTAYLKGFGPMYDVPLIGEGRCGEIDANTETIVIGNGITHIGSAVLWELENLKEVKISESVTSIAEGPFYACDNLKSLTIPKSVSTLHYYTFNGLNNLKDVYYGGSEDDWNKIRISYYEKGYTDSRTDYTFMADTGMYHLENVIIHYQSSGTTTTTTTTTTAKPTTTTTTTAKPTTTTTTTAKPTTTTTTTAKPTTTTTTTAKPTTTTTTQPAVTKLAITGQPTNVVAKNNAWITFRVTASGDGLTYQWQLSDNAGKTWRNSSIKKAEYGTTLTAKNDGRYVRCIVTDKSGASVASDAASMKITSLKITAQPTNSTVKNGATASFKVAAAGEGVKYQWQLSDDQGKTWRNSKATGTNYTAAVTDANNGRYVRCIVTDKYGNSMKSNAAIMKITSLKITAQPTNANIKKGETASFRLKAEGSGLTYQWQLSDDQGKTWRNSKATGANYAATLTDANNGRYVRCIVTDKFGNSIKSNAAIMKITSLKITAQPVSVVTKKGATASFKLKAVGSGLTYQWQLSDDQGKTWRNSKATGANYAAAVTDANNGRYVRCIVTDKFGNKVTSDEVSMTIR